MTISMFKKFVIIISLAFVLLLPATVLADKYGLQSAADSAGLTQTKIASYPTPMALVGAIVGLGLGFLGILFFALFFYAGVRWMLAMGKAEDVTKAKDIMEAAIIGLILVLAAYAISEFIFTNLIGGK